MTLQDVADAAGVSIATASRALNGGTRTTPARTRDHVLTVASHLGYRPHAHAQAVARGWVAYLGFLTDDVGDPCTAARLSALCRAARAHRVTLLVAQAGADARSAGEELDLLIGHGVRAVFVSRRLAGALRAPGTPGRRPPPDVRIVTVEDGAADGVRLPDEAYEQEIAALVEDLSTSRGGRGRRRAPHGPRAG
ncbi:LacI family DNA-binding transcriptional regulator [Kineococcus sp. SYSU DK001]|uniref:LacI family DNA-binding transcriptional regulator n=1 Tax=Kineococcus sp. SYSU DK001 TaxID=3383122 RepID=UPI003D7EC950